MSRTLPILCSGSVVRNILSGAQTQDRRPVRNPDGWRLANPSEGGRVLGCYHPAPPHLYAERDIAHPHAAGDVLYVRETWRPYIRGWSSHVQYQAGKPAHPWPVYGESLDSDASDLAMEWAAKRGGVLEYRGDDPDTVRWFPSIHMPKWAARIHLRVLSVGVERVNAISADDAEAEGINPECVGSCRRTGEGCAVCALSVEEHFGRLWDSLYGEGSFRRGEWCWVTKFEMVLP